MIVQKLKIFSIIWELSLSVVKQECLSFFYLITFPYQFSLALEVFIILTILHQNNRLLPDNLYFMSTLEINPPFFVYIFDDFLSETKLNFSSLRCLYIGFIYHSKMASSEEEFLHNLE